MYATVVFTLVFELSFSLLQYYRDIILFTRKNMKIILKSTVDYFQLHFYTFEKLLINSNWREIIHKVSICQTAIRLKVVPSPCHA